MGLGDVVLSLKVKGRETWGREWSELLWGVELLVLLVGRGWCMRKGLFQVRHGCIARILLLNLVDIWRSSSLWEWQAVVAATILGHVLRDAVLSGGNIVYWRVTNLVVLHVGSLFALILMRMVCGKILLRKLRVCILIRRIAGLAVRVLRLVDLSIIAVLIVTVRKTFDEVVLHGRLWVEDKPTETTIIVVVGGGGRTARTSTFS